MSRESVLARGQAQAEARMTDTCTVGLRVRSAELNQETLEYEYTIDPVYEGPCEIQFGNAQPRDVDAQSQLLVEQAVILKLPVNETTALVTDDHHALITDSLNDPGLIGMEFKVTGFNAKTYSTARRFPVVLVR